MTHGDFPDLGLVRQCSEDSYGVVVGVDVDQKLLIGPKSDGARWEGPMSIGVCLAENSVVFSTITRPAVSMVKAERNRAAWRR
jgi:hypothetical protein